MAMWLPTLEGRRGPRYLQIVEAMAEDIASGRLAVGSRLPPHRELAYGLGLSPNTTSRAYAEGVKRALLRGEVGRGTFVRAPDGRLETAPTGDLVRATSGPVDLSRNLPLAGFAEPHVRRVLAEIAGSDDVKALLDHQTASDLALHRRAAIAWLARHGVEATADEIVVTGGAQHGLFSTLMALLRPGDVLLVEHLSYPPVRAMADRLGIRTAAVTMDEAGLSPDALEAACAQARPKALYLTPTLQSPTTITLSSARRRAVAAIARRRDLLVIEDDVFAPLKPDRPEPIAACASERTVYLTGVSKAVAPGLRVGFVRAAEGLAAAVRHAVDLSTWMTPPITAEIAARLILDGTAERLAAEQRQAAAARQALARSFLGGVAYRADPEGLHLWLPLPEGWTADRFRAAAERRHVRVTEAGTFAIDRRHRPEAVRVCLSHEPSETRLRQGLGRLATLLRLPPERADMVV